jgi:hypothetical protein
MAIASCFIDGYWLFFYWGCWWLLIAILLMAIKSYFIMDISGY